MAQQLREVEPMSRGEKIRQSRDMAREMLKDSIVIDATAQFIALMLEEVHKSKIAPLRELLKEARDDLATYVDQDYPPETCAEYPDIARRHSRDMELCRRIDEALGDA